MIPKASLVTALRLTVTVALIWAVVAIILLLMQGREITYYPGVIVRVASLVPIFVIGFSAKHYADIAGRAPRPADLMVFSALAGLLIFAVTLIFEAMFVQALYGMETGKTFTEILTQPFADRYNIAVFFGMSFSTTAVIATLIATLFSFPPAVVRHLAKQQD